MGETRKGVGEQSGPVPGGNQCPSPGTQHHPTWRGMRGSLSSMSMSTSSPGLSKLTSSIGESRVQA